MSQRELAAFARYLKVERGSADRTVEAYVPHVRAWLKAQKSSRSALRQWLIDLPECAPSTTIVRLAAIKAWAKFKRDRELRLELEDIDRPKRRRGIPRGVPDWRERIRSFEPGMRAVAVLLFSTGMRIGEAISLRVDLPCPDETIIRGKGGVERYVFFNAAAKAALKTLGGSIRYRRRAIQDYFRKQGGFTPHQARHTYAQERLNAGADLAEVQQLLGHRSPDTTLMYAQYQRDRLREVNARRAPKTAR